MLSIQIVRSTREDLKHDSHFIFTRSCTCPAAILFLPAHVRVFFSFRISFLSGAAEQNRSRRSCLSSHHLSVIFTRAASLPRAPPTCTYSSIFFGFFTKQAYKEIPGGFDTFCFGISIYSLRPKIIFTQVFVFFLALYPLTVPYVFVVLQNSKKNTLSSMQ